MHRLVYSESVSGMCKCMCGNKKNVKPLEEAVRIVEREVHYLISWYVGMCKA